jgi:type IX secretion system PorP/SprF family membrane protein
MTLNPALTGKSVNDWRGAMNMRSQWWGNSIKPYYTVTASLEKKLGNNQNYFGLGGMVVSDQSNGGLLKNNYFSCTAAYHMSLDQSGRHELSAGLTGTYANRILDAGKFRFQSQLGSMGFQRDIPANDGIDIQKNNYFDVSAGLYYSFTGNAYGFSAGGALFHASQPYEGVYNNSTYHIPRKASLQAGGWMKIGNNDALHLSSLADIQGGNSVYTLGGVYKIGVGDELLHSVNLGLWHRFGDAVYPYFALETQRWVAGFTYDFVSSGVGSYASVQSLELSFVWQFGKTGSGTRTASGVLIY